MSQRRPRRTRRSFNVIDNRSFIKIDVFVPASGSLGTGQHARAQMLDVFPGVSPLPFLGPEDIVLQKLSWFRLGGEVSERQWRDVVSVLRIAARDLDDAYLDAVAEEHDLMALLVRARGAAVWKAV